MGYFIMTKPNSTTDNIQYLDALKRLEEERARIHKLCNKLSQMQEEIYVQTERIYNLQKQTERIYNLQKQILGETYNPRD